MSEFIYRVAGRASLIFNWLHSLFLVGRAKRFQKSGASRFDRTGLIVRKAEPIAIFWEDDDVLFPNYEMLPYAFARAQEFSLFRLYKSYLTRPLADFGCGDGSFGSVLFDEIDFGIDNDLDALAIANDYGIYLKMVESGDNVIPLEDNSVQTIMSNSVFEHVDGLETYLEEIRRILKDKGQIVFTVPLIKFKTDLAKYYGKRASARLNREAYHRNLYTAQEWKDLLARHGFNVILERQYQPDWFTFWCEILRLTGRTGFGLIVPGISMKIRNRYKRQFVEAVRTSIKQTTGGDCAFFIAQKLPK